MLENGLIIFFGLVVLIQFITLMLTCKTAYTKPDTANQTSRFFTEPELKRGGFVRLNILIFLKRTSSFYLGLAISHPT